MEAVAKHDFSATADDELSFRRSQVLKVHNIANINLQLQFILENEASIYIKDLQLKLKSMTPFEKLVFFPWVRRPEQIPNFLRLL